MQSERNAVTVSFLHRRASAFDVCPIGALRLVCPADASVSDRQRWLATAGPALFDLQPRRGAFPSGWVLLQGTLVPYGSGCTAKLYYDTGDGFREGHAITPPISLKGTIHELIWLPPGIKGLRWQAMQTAGEFEQTPLVMTKVGLVERTWVMIRRVVPALFEHSWRKRARVRLTFWRMIWDLQGAYGAAGVLRARASAPDYQTWIERFDTLTYHDRRSISRQIARLKDPPLISLWLPVRGDTSPLLQPTVESVMRQLYPHWDLHIALDHTCSDESRRVAEHAAMGDCRIQLQNGNAPELMRGEYIALLGLDDLLPEHALYYLAAEIRAHPDIGMVYTDEDCIDDAGVRSQPCFKPDWNPLLMLTCNYVGGLCAWRRDVLLGSPNIVNSLIQADGYGLALAAAQRLEPGQIRHLQFILCHHRRSPRPLGGKQALEQQLARAGVAAQVLPLSTGAGYRVRYALPDPVPLVSIIVPTRDGHDMLRRCIESVRQQTSYPRYEIIVVDNQSSDPATLIYLDELGRTAGISVLHHGQPFNFSAINNLAALQAKGDVLCLLNNDTEVISPHWLEEMVGHLCQANVGVVGAKLYYPDGRVQHAGDVVGVGGCASHLHSMIARDDPGYCNRAVLAQDLSAVTGACMATWRDLYQRLGGLNEKDLPVAFNDVDYCLRVREAGWRVVWTPHAELYHHESASRGHDKTPEQRRRAEREVKYMRRRWKQAMNHDPAYNPNLSQERADFSLSHAPIATPPWRK